MAFLKKIWKDRVTEYPTRRTLKKSDGSTEIVTVERAEGQVSVEGDPFSAATMNDLEDRVADEFESLNSNMNITYHSEDDYIYINGAKWKKANINSNILYDNGVLGEYPFTFKHMERINSAYDADVQSSDFQYLSNRMYAKVINTSWNWGSRTLTTTKPIDLTKYSSMHILFDATSPNDGYSGLYFGITADGTTATMINPNLKSNIYQSATSQEAVLDISSLKGEYYPFAELLLTSGGTRTLSVYKWWLE